MSAEPKGRRRSAPSILCGDPNGSIRRSLDSLISQGRYLRDLLETGPFDAELAEQRSTIDAWRVACLLSVGEGFEAEALHELRLALSSPAGEGTGAVLAMHRRRVSDGLALLEALRGTLERNSG